MKQGILEFLANCSKEDTKSHRSVSASTVSSRRCHGSSVSSASSIKGKLLEAGAKAATLKVKAAFLKRKEALKAAEEELELHQELQQAQIEEEMYAQYELDPEQNTNTVNTKVCNQTSLNGQMQRKSSVGVVVGNVGGGNGFVSPQRRPTCPNTSAPSNDHKTSQVSDNKLNRRVCVDLGETVNTADMSSHQT